jgi:hypothetical protein
LHGERVYVKVWRLPYDASSINVALISDTVPLLDELCRRVINFIYTCLNCNSDFVRSVASHGLAAGTRSPIGRTAAFCSLSYGTHVGRIGENKLTGRHCLKLYINKLNDGVIDQATALRAMIYVRESLYKFSNSDFNMTDAESLIRLLAR